MMRCMSQFLTTSLVAISLTLASSSAHADEAAQLAAKITAAVESHWQSIGVEPAERADDAEFFRRASLDLVGRIPTAAETRDFIENRSDQKRAVAIRELLRKPTHVVHFTNVWRSILLPEASSDVNVRAFVPGFEDWLRQRLLSGKKYDDLVREILTVPRLQVTMDGGGPMMSRPVDATPSAFYDAKGDTPESLAAASSRAFLGVRLECAQCHDHPFDPWTQDQFWELAAFFAAPGIDGPPSIKVHDSKRKVGPKFPDGTEPVSITGDARPALAEWITSGENPYFARALANRLWAHFFGSGLVEPVDDFSPSNPPTHPELLDLLANSLVEADYDIKTLIQAIVLSRPYQLTSRATNNISSDEIPETLARMPVRALRPEQLYDSLCQATGRFRVFNPNESVNFNNDADRTQFLEQFAREMGAATEQPTSILQALMLMNGQFIGESTELTESRTLAAIVESPFLTTNDKIESLYLTALTRKPTGDEANRASVYLQASDSESEGLADLFWALLNSSEFLFNH